VLAEPPEGGVVRWSSGLRCLVFEPIEIQVGDYAEPRRVVARLGVAEDGSAKHLMVGEPVRQAKVTLGGVECGVFLFSLFPYDYDTSSARMLVQYGQDRTTDCWREHLWSMNGAVYRLSPAARGETLKVEEYTGDAGRIEVKLGEAWEGMTLREMSVGGAGPSLIAAGPLLEEKGEFQVPVGRYYPGYMSLTKGGAWVALRGPSSSALLARRVGVSRGGRTELELAGRPVVNFMRPGKGERVQPGGEVQVEVVAAFPAWGLSVAAMSSPTEGADGSLRGRDMEPQVAVRDSKGSVVAQGAMPFG